MNGRRLAWLPLSVLALAAPSCTSHGTTSGSSTDSGDKVGDASKLRDAARSGDATGSGSGSAGSRRDAGKDGRGTSGNGSGTGSGTPDATVTPTDAAPAGQCNGSFHTSGTPASHLPAAPAVTVPTGFSMEVVATVSSARELVALPNGDLLVATNGADVYLVPNAEGTPDAPVRFASVNDAPVQGIAFEASTCTLAIASSHGIYAASYADGQTTATLGAPIASVRTGPVTHTASDTDTHTTTSVTFAGGKLFAAVGSSCNACTEADSTRAAVEEMNIDGSAVSTKATRIRNAIAITTNPATGTVWLGGAGQDALPLGHPYEFFDALTLHSGEADYGWPACEENHHAYVAGTDCSGTVAPLVEVPAYSTIIGAAFYPSAETGAHAFPFMYQGGLFLTTHGSWHTNPNGTYFSKPSVLFVAMNGDTPGTTVDWNDSSKQWTEFVGGFQLADGKTRIGRPTGIAVGAQGSLFVADDQDDLVYRIRPQ